MSISKTIISVVIVSVLVGGAIYAWQEKDKDNSINEISKSAEETKKSFEKEIVELQNKLANSGDKNKELLEQKKELEEKAKLLPGAKKEFYSDELGLTFFYPVEFGEAKVTFSNLDNQKSFFGKFENTDKISFGGISKEFKAASTSDTLNFLETKGFEEKRKKYYFKSVVEDGKYELKPAKTIETSNGDKALLLDRRSFVYSEGEKEIDIAQNIGAVFNLAGDDFSGMGIINTDLSVLSIAEFEKILSSINIK